MPRVPQRVAPYAVPMDGDGTMVTMTTADGRSVVLPRAAAERAGVELREPQAPLLDPEPEVPPMLARGPAPEEGIPPMLARAPEPPAGSTGNSDLDAFIGGLATAPTQDAPPATAPLVEMPAPRPRAAPDAFTPTVGPPAAATPETAAVVQSFMRPPPAHNTSTPPPETEFVTLDGRTVTAQPAAAPAGTLAPARSRAGRQPAAQAEPEVDPNAQLIDDLINRPEGADPLAPQDFRSATPLERALDRNESARRRAQEGAEYQMAAAMDRESVAAEAEAEQAALAARRDEAMNAATRAYAEAVREARSAQVNPSRLFQNGGGIAVAIASVLGSLGSALTGGPNTALETINRAIDRDIQAQTTNQANAQRTAQNARGFIDITRQRFSDEQAQMQAARSLALDQVAQRLERQSAALQSAGARDEAAAMADQLRQQSLQAARDAAIAEQTRLLEQRQAVADIRVREAEATRAERRAMGGGGGGRRTGIIPSAVYGTADDPIVRQAVELLGMDPVTAAEQAANTRGGSRAGRQRLLNRIGEAQERRGRLAQGLELEPGRTLNEQQIRDVNGLVAADREFNAAIGTIRRYAERLREGGLLGYGIEQLRGRAGFGSRDYQTLNHAIDVIRTQFRNINQSGNSLGAQQLAEHDFPNLTQSISLDAILNNVEAARDVKHRYVTAVLGSLGISAGGGGHGGGGEDAPMPEGVRPVE